MVSDFVFAADTAAVLLVLYIFASKITKLEETLAAGFEKTEIGMRSIVKELENAHEKVEEKPAKKAKTKK